MPWPPASRPCLRPHSQAVRGADYEVRNTAEQALLITGVTLKPGHTDRDPMQTPHCVAGLTLAPGAVCHLLVSKPH